MYIPFFPPIYQLNETSKKLESRMDDLQTTYSEQHGELMKAILREREHLTYLSERIPQWIHEGVTHALKGGLPPQSAASFSYASHPRSKSTSHPPTSSLSIHSSASSTREKEESVPSVSKPSPSPAPQPRVSSMILHSALKRRESLVKKPPSIQALRTSVKSIQIAKRMVKERRKRKTETKPLREKMRIVKVTENLGWEKLEKVEKMEFSQLVMRRLFGDERSGLEATKETFEEFSNRLIAEWKLEGVWSGMDSQRSFILTLWSFMAKNWKECVV